jgi:hypothetical protein
MCVCHASAELWAREVEELRRELLQLQQHRREQWEGPQAPHPPAAAAAAAADEVGVGEAGAAAVPRDGGGRGSDTAGSGDGEEPVERAGAPVSHSNGQGLCRYNWQKKRPALG